MKLYDIFYYPSHILSASILCPLRYIAYPFKYILTDEIQNLLLRISYVEIFLGTTIALSNMAYKYSSSTVLDISTPFTSGGLVPLLLSAGVHGLFNEIPNGNVKERLDVCPISTVLTSMICGLAANQAFNKVIYSLAPCVATAIAGTLGCSTYTKSAQVIIGGITLLGIAITKEIVEDSVYEMYKQ